MTLSEIKDLEAKVEQNDAATTPLALTRFDIFLGFKTFRASL